MMKNFILPIAILLLPFVAVLVWERSRYRRAPIRYLISLGSQSRWQTRPTLLQTEAELAFAREVGDVLESSGVGHATLCLFLGKPTMDVLLTPRSSEVTRGEIAAALQGRRVRIARVREGFRPLRYK